jgi:serine/threonine protein kinase
MDSLPSARSSFSAPARFAVRRRLGAGAMGVVYEAFDHEHGTVVALKTLRALDGQSLYRFKREFRAVRDLEHPNLVRLGELICHDGTWFFTMEYVDGQDLLAYVRPAHAGQPAAADRAAGRPSATASGSAQSAIVPTLTLAAPGDGPPLSPLEPLAPGAVGELATGRTATELFDERRLRSVLAQLTSGVAALHAVGKIHRDIKPSNILVTAAGRLVLLDFGIIADIVSAESTATDPDRISGTAAYMAPEQAVGHPAAPAADWYSLGTVLYQILTGSLPYAGSCAQILAAKQKFDAPAPWLLVADVPADLSELCIALLRRDPETRPSGAELVRMLGATGPRSTPRAVTGQPSSTPSPFVGRTAELASLGDAFAEVHQGRACMLFVQGESGVGKSELLRQFTTHCATEHPEALVLRGRCYERESVPFNALDGIADELSRHLMELPVTEAVALLPPHASQLPQLFSVLGRVGVIAAAPAQSTVEDRQEQRTRRFAALRELFARLARRRPVVLVVDDLQWADRDSLALLSQLLRPPDPPPLLVLATVRTSSAGGEPVRETIDRLLGSSWRRPGDLRSLELEPLSSASAMQLVAALMAAAPAAAQAHAAAIAQESRGHPMFIQELVRHLGDRAIPDPVRGAVRLDEAIRSRVTRLPDGARHLLELLCVAGAPVPQRVLRHACGTAPAEYAGAVALLDGANLIRIHGHDRERKLEPVHDRVTESVLVRLEDDRKRQHHRALAVALEHAGAGVEDPQALVRHLAGAGEEQRAAAYAEQAADQADKALALGQAAHLYRIALALGAHDEAHRRSLHLRLGEVLAADGRGPDAAEALLLAAQGAGPDINLECRRRAAEQLLSSGHLDVGLAVTRELLRDCKVPFPETRGRVLWSLLCNRLRLRLHGLRWQERRASECRDSELHRVDLYKSVADGLTLIDPVRSRDFGTRGLLLALRTGEIGRIARSLAIEASFLTASGTQRARARARMLLQRIHELAARHDDPMLAAWAQSGEAICAYFASAFRQAAERFAPLQQLIIERKVPLSRGWELSSVRIFHLWALRQVGEMNQLRSAYDHYLREARQRGDRYGETTMLRSCTPLALAGDDLEAAEQAVTASTWQPLDNGVYHVQHYMALRARLMHALYARDGAALGRLAPAITAQERSLVNRVHTLRIEIQSLVGRLELLAATGAAASAAVRRRARRRAAACQRENLPMAGVCALQVQASAAWLAGDLDTARRCLEELASAAGAAHFLWTAMAARHRLGLLVGGSQGATAVAEAEGWAHAHGVEKPHRFFDVQVPVPPALSG